MLAELYVKEIGKCLQAMIEKEKENIAEIAETVAERVALGGTIHLLDHGHLLGAEMTARAGGLALIHTIRVDDVKNPVIVRPADVLFIASVSGRSRSLVEAALLAKKRGVFTVALTSSAQNGVTEPEDPKLGLLPGATDRVLDIQGVAGDAILRENDASKPFIPASGILSVALMWSLVAELVGALRRKGIEPTIYTSVNVPGGQEAFESEVKRYSELGY